jgi:hypothetical protein
MSTRRVALISAVVAISVGLFAAPTPVRSHVGGTVKHLWQDHIKPRTDNRYHTKAKLAKSGKAPVHWNNLTGIPKGGLIKTSTKDAACPSSVDFTSTFTKIGNIGSFTKKVGPKSIIEATFNGRIFIETVTSTGARFELRIDEAATTVGRIRADIRSVEVGHPGLPVSMTGSFTGLGAGSHTVSMWVQAAGAGTGTDAQWDNGCWNSNHLVLREIRSP